jgi:TRAP-type mannitol/chloroaromatic compound transport system permease large subunit
MGATGALVMAVARRRLDMPLLRQAMDTTMKISSFVLFILIGSTVFSLSFQAVDGPVWVEHLLTSLPGGQLGFLIVVNVLIFFLAFFLDFFELSFIVIPLIAPVADKLGIDLVWFGVLLAVNMQTSFMHPPFGFALFYLRSVAPTEDYDDRITSRRIAKVTTGQIYWGAVPFVLIQILMVGLIIAFPKLVSTGAGGGPAVDVDKAFQQMQKDSAPRVEPPATFAPDGGASASPPPADPPADKAASDDEAMKRLLEATTPKKP